MRKSTIIVLLALSIVFITVGLASAEIKEKVVDGVHLRWGIPEIPDSVMSYRSSETARPKDHYEFIPAEEYVPLGVYLGDWGDATWDFTLKQIRQFGGNFYYVNGGHGPLPGIKLLSRSKAGLKELTRRAARLGVRIYYQDQSSSLHWPNNIKTGPPREKVYMRVKQWADDILPRFATDPELRAGMLVWGPTEEIDEATARDKQLKKLRDYMQELDPYHPCVVLVMPHTAGVQQALFETWEDIPIAHTDHYLNHRGLNRKTISGFNLRRLKLWSDMVRQHGAKFWMIVGCFSMRNNPDPSNKSGHRILAPQEVRMSLWTALAYGVSGFSLFHYYDNDSAGRACLTRFDWKPTEEYVAAGTFFSHIKRFSPLVGKWKRLGEVKVKNNVAVSRFKHPDYSGTFIVAANSDSWESASVPMNSVYELEGFTPVKGTLKLSPGAGTILFRGSKDELSKLKQLLGDGAYPVRSEKLMVENFQLWKVDKSGDKFSEKINITGQIRFGGRGAMPVINRSTLPGWKGKLMDWGNGIKVPSCIYYPPYPGKNETVLYLKWDASSLAGVRIKRAELRIKLAKPVSRGRLGIYPVVQDGLGLTGQIEYMPRWEDSADQLILSEDNELTMEITGILREWASGKTVNKGLLVVYEGFPGKNRNILLREKPVLVVEYHK